MDENTIDLAKYRLEKSKGDFHSSRILLDNNLFSQSINRSYYSIFHAVRAILAFDRYDSKKHSGIIAYFNRNYVATGKFDKSYSKILMGAELIRNKSDYNDFYVTSRTDAEKQLENAEKFFNGIENYINGVLGIK